MSITIDSLSHISPTLTLAELFENQKHYIAAYTIYRCLYLQGKHEKTVEKLRKLKDYVFSGTENNTLSSLYKIFDEKEADELGVFSTDLYGHFKEVVDQLTKEESVELKDSDKDEEHYFAKLEKSVEIEWRDLLSAEKQKKVSQETGSIRVTKIEWSEVKLADFIEFLLRLNKNDHSLDELKLADIMEAFLRQYTSDDEQNKDKK